MARLKHHLLGWKEVEFLHQHSDERKSTKSTEVNGKLLID